MSEEKKTTDNTVKQNETHDPKAGGTRPQRHQNFEYHKPKKPTHSNNIKKGS